MKANKGDAGDRSGEFVPKFAAYHFNVYQGSFGERWFARLELYRNVSDVSPFYTTDSIEVNLNNINGDKIKLWSMLNNRYEKLHKKEKKP